MWQSKTRPQVSSQFAGILHGERVTPWIYPPSSQFYSQSRFLSVFSLIFVSTAAGNLIQHWTNTWPSIQSARRSVDLSARSVALEASRIGARTGAKIRGDCLSAIIVARVSTAVRERGHSGKSGAGFLPHVIGWGKRISCSLRLDFSDVAR